MIGAQYEAEGKAWNNSRLGIFSNSNRFTPDLLLYEKTIYHIGASIKDLGKKVFGFSKLGLDAKQIMNMLGVTV